MVNVLFLEHDLNFYFFCENLWQTYYYVYTERHSHDHTPNQRYQASFHSMFVEPNLSVCVCVWLLSNWFSCAPLNCVTWKRFSSSTSTTTNYDDFAWTKTHIHTHTTAIIQVLFLVCWRRCENVHKISLDYEDTQKISRVKRTCNSRILHLASMNTDTHEQKKKNKNMK